MKEGELSIYQAPKISGDGSATIIDAEILDISDGPSKRKETDRREVPKVIIDALVNAAGDFANPVIDWAVDNLSKIKQIPKGLLVKFADVLKERGAKKVEDMRSIKPNWLEEEMEGDKEYVSEVWDKEVSKEPEVVVADAKTTYETEKAKLEELLTNPAPGIAEVAKKELERLEIRESIRIQGEQATADYKAHQEKWGSKNNEVTSMLLPDTPATPPPLPNTSDRKKIVEKSEMEKKEKERRLKIDSFKKSVDSSVKTFETKVQSDIDKIKKEYDYDTLLAEKKVLVDRIGTLEDDINEAEALIQKYDTDKDSGVNLRELKEVVSESQSDLKQAKAQREKIEKKLAKADVKIQALRDLRKKNVPEVENAKKIDSAENTIESVVSVYTKRFIEISELPSKKDAEKAEIQKQLFETFDALVKDLDKIEIKNMYSDTVETISLIKRLIKELKGTKDVAYSLTGIYAKMIYEKLKAL